MARIVYIPDRAAQAKLFHAPNGPVGRHLIQMGNKLERLAKRDVGAKTGALRRSIRSDLSLRSTGLVMTVGSSHRIAYLHHEGTKPHVILPMKSSALRFQNNGSIIFAREINHPGTRGNPYLRKNLAIVVLSS